MGVVEVPLAVGDGGLPGCPRRAGARVVLGSGDRLTPVRGTLPLQDALTDPQVVVLESSGHTLMTEATNELMDSLRELR